MTPHDLAPFVTAFFTRHLPAERNASPHTIAAYRDAMKLLLRSLAAAVHRDAAALHVEDLTPERLLQFLPVLETTRHNGIRTRNARLAAIHSFVRYVLDSEPALAALGQRLLAVPFRKAVRPVLGYLSDHALAQLLAQIDRTTPAGERDYLLLALLYDTGARVQQILDVAPRDFRLVAPPFVRLRGKGQRERLVPLLPQTARLVTRYLATRHIDDADRAPLLRNRRADPLTRHGARYLLAKYVQRARYTICIHIHTHEGAAGTRRILGALALAKRYGPVALEDAAKAALDLRVLTYRFLRRYLERRPPLTLRQVDPLRRQRPGSSRMGPHRESRRCHA